MKISQIFDKGLITAKIYILHSMDGLKKGKVEVSQRKAAYQKDDGQCP